MRAGNLLTNVTCHLAWSPAYSCQWFDCLNPLCSLCLGAGLNIIMNVIFGDNFEEVALHIALHSCKEKKQIRKVHREMLCGRYEAS